MSSIIEALDLHTSFGRNQIHKGLSFSINEPGIVALIGGSGSGKSVFLRALLGLLRPSQGKVLVKGISLVEEQDSPVRDTIGVLFQQGALFSGLTVWQNVAVPLRERLNFSGKVLEQLIESKLLMAGLDPAVGNKFPSELSGGMKKRAALARALILDPKILVLDEPTSGLDPVAARAFDTMIRTLAESLRMTVLVVTHDLDTLAGVVDRILVLGEGKLIADGSYYKVKRVEHPWIKEYFSSRVI